MKVRLALVVLVWAVASLAGLAQVWACTGQAGFKPLAVQSAPTGTALAVAGQMTAAGPVSIRWDGLDGPLLATVQAGGEGNTFSDTVTVPDARPGVHLLLLVQDEKVVARATFEVAAPGSPVVMRAPPSRSESGRDAAQRNIGVLSGGLLAVAASGLLVVSRRRAVTSA